MKKTFLRRQVSISLKIKLVEKIDKLAKIGETNRNRVVAGMLQRYSDILMQDLDLKNKEHLDLIRHQIRALPGVEDTGN